MTTENYMLAGLVIYFATHVLNRFLTERNYKSLAAEEKLKLVEGFATHRSLATYVPIAIMLIVIVIVNYSPRLSRVVFPIGVAVVMAISIAVTIAIIRRLSELALPSDYVRKFRNQSLLVQIGYIAAMSMFALGVMSK